MLIRGFKLLWILISYRLDQLFLPKYCCLSAWLLPIAITKNSKVRLKMQRGERIALAFEAMGPLFIKFGQALSMRQDIFPEDVVLALTRLQDDVVGFDANIAIQVIENDLGKSIKELFSKFEPQALAAASIAQVHAAQLITGEQVVVKVLRPKIQQIVARDIGLLYKLAKIANLLISNSRKLHLIGVVKELQGQLDNELDLQVEAANASLFKTHFPDTSPLKVPKIYWHLVTKHVLVLERIYGVPVLDVAQLKSVGANCEYLAQLGLTLFFKQVFENNFFHADLHGGNVFVDVSDLNKPSYICVDFGIMGALSESDKYYIAENLVAFFNRDYRRVAKLHFESGWVGANIRLDQFEARIRAVSEPVFALPLAEISFGKLLVSLFKTARQFEVEIQPQLILLQKTLFNVEALARALDPNLDLWVTAKPYLEGWVKSQFSLKYSFNKVRSVLPIWLEKAPELPQLLHKVLNQSVMINANHEVEVEQRSCMPGYLHVMLGVMLGVVGCYIWVCYLR